MIKKMGGVGCGGGGGGVQGEFERRFEVFVKMPKKIRGWRSGSGEGRVGVLDG